VLALDVKSSTLNMINILPTVHKMYRVRIIIERHRWVLD
jgi:hypothetical protein